MPFGLRNAGATYQRCMQKCLHDQIDKTVHVYVDDIVIKTKESRTLIDDLRETFANLRRFQMKLNPAKCTFGVPAGKLLGFLVSSRGIEVNPGKISAIERMKPPTNLKEVQKFTGCLASLSHFISRLGEKALPLYQLMKKFDICLDDASRCSFQGVEADAVNSTGVGISNAEGADVALYSGDQQSCQCSGSSGARGRRQNRAAAGILFE
jgi:hypothetical protein